MGNEEKSTYPWGKFQRLFRILASGYDYDTTFEQIDENTLFIDLIDEEDEVTQGKVEYVGDFKGTYLLRVYTEDGNSLVSSHKAAFGLFYV